MIKALLLSFLVLLIIAILPTWPYNRRLGYASSGGLGVVLVIFLVIVAL